MQDSRVKKGNIYQFKPNSVPNNKGVKREKVKNSPAPYVRLSGELDAMVWEVPTASERQEMLLLIRESSFECPDDSQSDI